MVWYKWIYKVPSDTQRLFYFLNFFKIEWPFRQRTQKTYCLAASTLKKRNITFSHVPVTTLLILPRNSAPMAPLSPQAPSCIAICKLLRNQRHVSAIMYNTYITYIRYETYRWILCTIMPSRCDLFTIHNYLCTYIHTYIEFYLEKYHKAG